MGEKSRIPTTPADSMATFYTPTNLLKKQAPEQYPARVIEALAIAQGNLRSKKKINKVADKFFLANALTENRPYDDPGQHGVLTGTFDDREKDRFINTAMKLPYSEDQDVANAHRYGVVFTDKTGRFSDAVLGKKANDSARISAWNGRGRAIESATGQLADAENHAQKVMNLEKILSHPKNKPLLDFFNRKRDGK